jgi:hypothetical protein
VANSLYNFGSEVLWSSTEGVGLFTFLFCLNALLTQTKICDFQITVAIQKNIFRLEISINDAILMQTADCAHQLSSVEACSPLREFLLSSQMREQLSSVEEIHSEVKLCISLECVM